jgi:rhamnosyltransferase
MGRVLDALGAQTVEAEIIVIDSGSTDGTLDMVLARPAVRLLTIPGSEFTYGRALNRGFAAASTAILVALSAHALPVDRRWLERLLEPFADPTIGAVYGRQLPHDDLDPFRRAEVIEYWRDEPHEDRPGAARYSNANGALRAELWREHPFDEAIPYAEDHLWAEWALAAGHRVVYEPSAAVYHSHAESVLKRFQRMRALAVAEKTRESRADAWRRFVGLCRSDMRRVAKHPRDWRWVPYSPLVRAAEVLADRSAPRRR